MHDGTTFGILAYETVAADALVQDFDIELVLLDTGHACLVEFHLLSDYRRAVANISLSTGAQSWFAQFACAPVLLKRAGKITNIFNYRPKL